MTPPPAPKKPRVKISRELQILISEICSRLDVDGLRGDLVVNRAARALVAYEGRDTVTKEDVGKIITSCLNHRWAVVAAWECGCVRVLEGECLGLSCAGVWSGSRQTNQPGPQPTNPQPPTEPNQTRLRKDPLDPIDSGTKVAILFSRLTDPEFVKREEAAKKKKEEAEKAAAAAPKKAGAWGGLPPARR